MLEAYIQGQKPQTDARGHAADGVIYLKIEFCFTGLDENMKRSDRT